jgi:hypothetical protein
MRTVLLLFALFAAVSLSAQEFKIGTYKVTPGKLAGWGVTAVGGLADGLVEGFEFDGRTFFVRKHGADRYGYWGDLSWTKVYNNRDPAQGFKSPLHRWVGAWDFVHNMDDLRKVGYMGGSVVLGISGSKSNSKWWHYAADFTISFALSAVAKSAGMAYIRN